MVELADTQVLGACAFGVGVRVPLSAPDMLKNPFQNHKNSERDFVFSLKRFYFFLAVESLLAVKSLLAVESFHYDRNLCACGRSIRLQSIIFHTVDYAGANRPLHSRYGI